jgi:hypothetical protein
MWQALRVYRAVLRELCNRPRHWAITRQGYPGLARDFQVSVTKQELIDYYTAQGYAVNKLGNLERTDKSFMHTPGPRPKLFKRIRLGVDAARYEQRHEKDVIWFLISSAYYSQITIEDGILKGL